MHKRRGRDDLRSNSGFSGPATEWRPAFRRNSRRGPMSRSSRRGSCRMHRRKWPLFWYRKAPHATPVPGVQSRTNLVHPGRSRRLARPQLRDACTERFRAFAVRCDHCRRCGGIQRESEYLKLVFRLGITRLWHHFLRGNLHRDCRGTFCPNDSRIWTHQVALGVRSFYLEGDWSASGRIAQGQVLHGRTLQRHLHRESLGVT
mmetsp:Transcript_8028/g.24107  ORF Transcript_8028/g.24107 Transcript_8028/m.24107 type:complete len:203 (-) Transcript_8028:67-675(-)